METIKQVLIERDDMSPAEADEMIRDARTRVAAGEDPEEILQDEFGLEPDFIFELI